MRSRAGSLGISSLLGLVLACTEPPAPAQTGPVAPVFAPAEPSQIGAQPSATGPVVAPAQRYREPAPEVVAVVDAAPVPDVALAPDGRTLLVAEAAAQPPLELVAQPFLGLAGERIVAATNARKRTEYYHHLRLVDVATGASRVITGLPANLRSSWPDWSPDGRSLAFTHTTEDRVELWVASVATGAARRLIDARLNATFDQGFVWLAGSERLVVRLVPHDRGPAPVGPEVALGPIVDESSGRAATNRTWQDLLGSPLDDALFSHYFTSELAIVTLAGELTRIGSGPAARGVLSELDPSPDGRWLRVERLLEPYSHVVPWDRFASRVELWSLTDPSAPPQRLTERPVAEAIPIEGVRTGPRELAWQPLAEPATLIWAEALDGGDPRAPIPDGGARDRVMRLVLAPGDLRVEQAEELTRVRHRYAGIAWLAQPGRYLISEYDRDRRWRTTSLRAVGEPGPGRVVFDRSIHDAYADPGRPVLRNLADDTWVVRVDGEGEGAVLYLEGDGASPTGDRPFLDRVALAELAPGAAATRLFQAPVDRWARFVGFAGDANQIVVRREGPEDPPQWRRESLAGGEPQLLIDAPHPHPQLDGMGQRLLSYRRRDGVPLSATLYTPPGYEPQRDGRLPLLIWAYPREYVDADTGGQVRAAPTRFTQIGGSSPNLLLLDGYAVLLAAMPVVGDPETMNDTLIEQLVMSAEAAIDAVVELGVADRERVAVGGHSYGAFMVANLLAHSDLFRAGVARSGAYNRSLTPFGFQSERRTLWEAPEAYVRVSPLFAADRIDEPILLIHGELDDNPGTFPLQTRRLFHALAGLGGTVRMVVLPHEAHGYQARESVLHVAHETSAWLDRWLSRPGD